MLPFLERVNPDLGWWSFQDNHGESCRMSYLLPIEELT